MYQFNGGLQPKFHPQDLPCNNYANLTDMVWRMCHFKAYSSPKLLKLVVPLRPMIR